MLTKILLFLLIMASIVLLNDIVAVIVCFITSKKFEEKPWRRIIRWMAIAYILTIIITGL